MDAVLLRKLYFAAAGAIVGGGVGYIVARAILEEDDAWEIVGDETDHEEAVYTEIAEEPPVLEIVAPKPEKKKKPKIPVISNTDYTTYSKRSEIRNSAVIKDLEEKLLLTASDLELGPSIEMEETNQPSVITRDSYEEDRQCKKLAWTYYALDDVVADENENVVPHPENILGDDALLSFGEKSDDPDIVYVRNPKLMKVYEIVQKQEEFNVVVMGKPKSKKRKAVRKEKNEDSDEE